MEVSREKSKIMTNSTCNISTDISMNGQKLEEITSFKHLGATVCKDGTCSARNLHQDCLSNGQTRQDLAVQHHQFTIKFKLFKSLITYILLYDCETWTLLAYFEKKGGYQKKILAFKIKSLRKLLCISYSEHTTDDSVQSKINCFVGLQEPLLATVKRWKLAWFGHVTRPPLRVGNAVVGRGNAGWTISKSGHLWPYQNCSQGPLAEKKKKKKKENDLC